MTTDTPGAPEAPDALADDAPVEEANPTLLARVRLWVHRLISEPNPVWIRELQQSARITRTSVILTVITAMMTLAIASLGGVVSSESSPAVTGTVAYHVFFSIAYFIVTLVGPALAANSVAAEREGHTWEALILTGMTPGAIARGKLFAALTSIGVYVVMFAPVGALPFLFGGVTAAEVILAFIGLALIALISVAFGLAISSHVASLRTALLLTLVLAFPAAVLLFGVFGLGMCHSAHHAWSAVPDRYPIWIPTAYARVPFDRYYGLYLIWIPCLAVGLATWFLYEVTIANLTGENDDRSTGLKRWFLVAAPAVLATLGAMVNLTSGSNRLPAALLAEAAFAAFFGGAVFLFAAEPIGPSRRTTSGWDRRRAGVVRRFLGPSLMGSSILVLVVGVLGLAALALFSVTQVRAATALAGLETHFAFEELKAHLFAMYAIGFFVFLAGLAPFLRSRIASGVITRVALLAVLFVASVGPWVVAAIAGFMGNHDPSNDPILFAAPSPFFTAVMLAKLDEWSAPSQASSVVMAGAIASVAYGLLGALLFGAASSRCRAILKASGRPDSAP